MLVSDRVEELMASGSAADARQIVWQCWPRPHPARTCRIAAIAQAAHFGTQPGRLAWIGHGAESRELQIAGATQPAAHRSDHYTGVGIEQRRVGQRLVTRQLDVVAPLGLEWRMQTEGGEE